MQAWFIHGKNKDYLVERRKFICSLYGFIYGLWYENRCVQETLVATQSQSTNFPSQRLPGPQKTCSCVEGKQNEIDHSEVVENFKGCRCCGHGMVSSQPHFYAIQIPLKLTESCPNNAKCIQIDEFRFPSIQKRTWALKRHKYIANNYPTSMMP